MTTAAPPIEGLLETAIYVADMTRAAGFYADVLGLPAMLQTPRLTACDAAARACCWFLLAG